MTHNAYGCGVIRFRLLGPLEFVDQAGGPVEVSGRQARIVVAALAIAGGRPVTADTLIEAVWGEDAPASARAAPCRATSRASAGSSTAAQRCCTTTRDTGSASIRTRSTR